MLRVSALRPRRGCICSSHDRSSHRRLLCSLRGRHRLGGSLGLGGGLRRGGICGCLRLRGRLRFRCVLRFSLGGRNSGGFASRLRLRRLRSSLGLGGSLLRRSGLRLLRRLRLGDARGFRRRRERAPRRGRLLLSLPRRLRLRLRFFRRSFLASACRVAQRRRLCRSTRRLPLQCGIGVGGAHHALHLLPECARVRQRRRRVRHLTGMRRYRALRTRRVARVCLGGRARRAGVCCDAGRCGGFVAGCGARGCVGAKERLSRLRLCAQRGARGGGFRGGVPPRGGLRLLRRGCRSGCVERDVGHEGASRLGRLDAL